MSQTMPPIDLSQPVPVDTFRIYYPAFQDETKYSDELCQYYLDWAFIQVRAERWGEAFAQGQMLWAAHFITLDAADQAAMAAGRPAGFVSGMISSKSVGSVSVGYDLTTASEQGAGHWNSTIYGKRFWRMMQLAGMGGIQLL